MLRKIVYSNTVGVAESDPTQPEFQENLETFNSVPGVDPVDGTIDCEVAVVKP